VTYRLAPAAASAVGLFLAVVAATALILHASQAAVVFGLLAVAHLGAAAGSRSSSRLVAGASVALGALTLVLVLAIAAFIAGIEAGVGLDLNAAWFAPLNGYATIAVGCALGAASVVLVAAGVSGLRSPRVPATS
jgi:hypothetical protein